MKTTLFLLSLISLNAYADESRLSLNLGIQHSGNTTWNASSNGSDSYALGGHSALKGLDVQAEYTYQTSNIIGASVILGTTTFKTDKGSDQLTSIMVAPRAAMDFTVFNKRLSAFTEVGVGPQLNVFQNNYGTSNGNTLAIVNSNSVSLVLSPRIGADLYLNDTTFIGFQMAYTTTSQTLNMKTIDNNLNTVSTFSQSYTRHWFSNSVRIGLNF